jgi:hypothetical protein
MHPEAYSWVKGDQPCVFLGDGSEPVFGKNEEDAWRNALSGTFKKDASTVVDKMIDQP